MTYKKCWNCQEWTREDHLEFIDIEGRPEAFCLKCVEALNARDKELEGKKSAKKRRQDVQGKSSLSGSGSGTHAETPKGAGAESEPVGSGDDPSTSGSPRSDKCFTQGCEQIATYSQTYRVEGQTVDISIRRCRDHKEMVSDLAPGKLINVNITG